MQSLSATSNSFDPSSSSILTPGARDSLAPVPTVATATVQTLKLKEGEFVFSEGDVPKGIYQLKAGVIKIVTQRPLTRGRASSPEFINKLVSPGEFFGFKALLQGNPYSFYAKTLKPSEILIYSPESLDLNSPSNPIARAVLLQMARDLETHEQTAQLHYLASVQERIAFQLALLAEKFGLPTPEGLSINLRLTRNELAQLAGTINESLSRHLTELKMENIIEVHGKEIVVKNLPKLKELSGNFKSL